MRGAPFLLAVTVSASLLVATPASACSMMWTPFGASLGRLLPEEIAARARAAIAFDIQTDTHQRGTLTLREIRCIRSGRPGIRCPANLTIRFESHWDGASCPGPFDGIRPEQAASLRYFRLWREPDGNWRVLRADRHMWRR